MLLSVVIAAFVGIPIGTAAESFDNVGALVGIPQSAFSGGGIVIRTQMHEFILLS